MPRKSDWHGCRRCSSWRGWHRASSRRSLGAGSWPVDLESAFKTLPLSVMWCKPPPGNPHDYRVLSLDRARQKQKKQRNSGGRLGEIGARWRSTKFAPPAKPRYCWPFAGVKKPGASPGFGMMVVLGRRHAALYGCNACRSAMILRRSPLLGIPCRVWPSFADAGSIPKRRN